jgi:hypothetical protein
VVFAPDFDLTVRTTRQVPFLMPFTVAPMTRQIFFDEAATTPDSLAPEGMVNLPKVASAFYVAAFFVLMVGAT